MTRSEILPRANIGDAQIERIKRILGSDHGDVFARLWAEYLYLRMCFNDLKNGFKGEDPPMIPVWAVAAEFQKRYRNLLVETIVMTACRLTDHRKGTVSIKALPRLFAGEQRELKTEVRQLVRTATTASEALRLWRNRQLAHTAKEKDRTAVSGDEAEAAVDAIHEALAFVWRRRLGEDNPEEPRPRPASAPLGEHLSCVHERMAAFAEWLLATAGHDDRNDILGAAAAVRRIAGGAGSEAADAGDESDPVVGFLMSAQEARDIISRIAETKRQSMPARGSS